MGLPWLHGHRYEPRPCVSLSMIGTLPVGECSPEAAYQPNLATHNWIERQVGDLPPRWKKSW